MNALSVSWQWHNIISWEPEGCYHYSMNIPLRTRRALSLYKFYVAIVPLWFWMEHSWTALTPFWFSANNMSTCTCVHSHMACVSNVCTWLHTWSSTSLLALRQKILHKAFWRGSLLPLLYGALSSRSHQCFTQNGSTPRKRNKPYRSGEEAWIHTYDVTTTL